MATCKKCNAEIPDGQEYCEKCLKDGASKADESYLDNLLKNVINTSSEESAVKSEKVLKKNNNIPASTVPIEDVQADESGSTVNEEEILRAGVSDSEGAEDSGPDNRDDIFSFMTDYPEEDANREQSEEEAVLPVYNEDTGVPDQDDDSADLDTDDDLLKLLDMISAQSDMDKSSDAGTPNHSAGGADTNQAAGAAVPDDGQDGQTFNEDILAIDELFNNTPPDVGEIQEGSDNAMNIPDNVGKVFSDAVSAIDSLEDGKDQPEDVPLAVPPHEIPKIFKEISDNAAEGKKEGEREKKKGLFQKLFAKDKSQEGQAGKDNAGTDGADTDKLKNSKKKPKKNKKGSPAADGEDENNQPVESKAAAKAKKKAEKAGKQKNANNVLKAVKKIDADEDDGKKINKAAATLIFSFFAVLAIFILLGTNTYSYSLSMQNADREFQRKRYTQAYNEICGLDIKKQDKNLYDKIMTVMFVNKQLNSYYNFYKMGMYPAALDSLLKGMEKYDKYMVKAEKLGIKEDLDDIREQILAELDSKFNINEKEAEKLNKNKDQLQYSKKVILAASQN